jgi:CRISPR/Cas system-associated exonuclease Cas4 (RecB family)
VDTSELDLWRAAVGATAASEYSAAGLRRGTALHESVEEYVAASPGHVIEFSSKRELEAFTAARAAIDDNVGVILEQECFLYSDALEMAGACDMVARWRGVPSIVDFKTSSALKSASSVLNYWMQLTAYFVMYEERTGIRCEQLVIVMAIVDDPVPVVYVRPVDRGTIDRVIEAREVFRVKRNF